MSQDLDTLIEQARSVRMTPEQREEQRRSFAYGNTKIENDHITRSSVDMEAQRMAQEAQADGAKD